MANTSAKQQIVQNIKDVTNILVTVSKDPSVDELSAALGLTIFLNALGKHATAVFSGKVPPAITFLEPDKTFEETADSLRDFIIALDKEKADHLRYKVVDDAVKIFITPYRTTISEKDLEFSQGDYNVELVLALNVENSDHLDASLAAHGRIFHDATIATVTSGVIKSTLGVTDWHDGRASGVSEMLVELIDDLKTSKVALDEQMATALLTGIVATTERFSNELTSSKTMNAAAELMAAGANQQLIAVQLQEKAEEEPEKSERASDEDDDDGDDNPQGQDAEEDGVSGDLDEGASTKLKRDGAEKAEEPEEPEEERDGSLSISHEKKGDVDEVARQTRDEQQEEAARLAQDRLDKLSRVAEETEVESDSEPETDDDAPEEESEVVSESTESEPAPLADLPPVVMPAFEPAPMPAAESAVEKAVAAASDLSEPSIGGTLNATTEQAAGDKRRELLSDQNKTILHHGTPYTGEEPAMGDSPLNAAMGDSDEPPSVDVFGAPPNSAPADMGMRLGREEKSLHPLGQSLPTEPIAMQEQDASARATDTHDDARSAVEAALAAVPVTPVATPAAPPTLADIESSQGLPPLPDFSTLPPPPPMPIGAVPDGIPSLDVPMSPVQSQPVTTGMPTQPEFSQPSTEFNPNQFQIPKS